MAKSDSTPTTRAQIASLFRDLVRSEQALLHCLASHPEELERALLLVGEAVAMNQVSQLLPTSDQAQGKAIIASLAGLGRDHSPLQFHRAGQALRHARITRKALNLLGQVTTTRTLQRALSCTIEARNQILEANQGLVRGRVESHLRRGAGSTCDGFHEEAMQEGNLALMSAIDRFQPRLGYAFSTFAMRGVDAAIREAKVSLRGNIRLTEGDRRKLKSILETESHLKHILLRKPSLEEIAENLGMPLAEAELVCQASQMEGRYDLSPAEARQGDVHLPHEPPPEETEATRISKIRSSEISQALVQALGQLPHSQARILALRSGMDGDGSYSQLRCQILSKRTEPTSKNGDESCTPLEIAAALQLSVARVSQLEAWGLRGMRQVMRSMMGQEARYA